MSDDIIVGTGEYVTREDFEAIGHAAADLKIERDAARREVEVWKHEAAMLKDRLDQINAVDVSDKARVMSILMDDLEHSINLLTRFAYALGIQEGGDLYDEVQKLRTKYKMGAYRPPTEYSYAELVTPDLSSNIIEGTETPKEINERT